LVYVAFRAQKTPKLHSAGIFERAFWLGDVRGASESRGATHALFRNDINSVN